MDEILEVLNRIALELSEINSQLNEIKGIGVFNSISDVYDKLDSIEDKIYDIESLID